MTLKSQGIVCRPQRLVLRHGSEGGYRNMSIIQKWKEFRTSGTLPRVGRPASPSGRGGRGDQALLYEERRTFQKDDHLCSPPQIRPVWWKGQTEAISKKHLKDSQTVRNFILWRDEKKDWSHWPECQVPCLEETAHQRAHAVPTVKHGGTIVLWNVPQREELGD